MGHHFGELLNEFFLIFPFIALAVRIFDELLLQIIIMTLFTWANVSFCVRKQIIWTEGKKIEFTYICLIEVVSCGKADK